MLEILVRRLFNSAKYERALVAVMLVLLVAFSTVAVAWTPGHLERMSGASKVPGANINNVTFVDVITQQLPLPLVNNTTFNIDKSCPPSLPQPPSPLPSVTPLVTPSPKQLRLAVGGDVRLMASNELDTLKALGITEVHVVVPDAGTYKDVLAAIKARGMVPVYDGEVPFWVNHMANTQYNAQEMAALKAIYDAGWHNFASEGLYTIQVVQINGVGFNVYNYGGDQGNNMYTEFYGHPHGSHFANYEEFYSSWLASKTLSTVLYQAKETPCNNGFCFGLWTNDVLPNGATYVKQFNAQGAKITTVIFWCGLTQKPSTFIGEGGVYHQAYHNLKDIKL